jgi:hypothetical protein
MRLGMMQPYFLPYAGYFSLIHATDFWVIFDTPQYIRRGWVNRNRVLSEGKDGWKYIRIPVQHAPRETRIADVLIDERTDWVQQLLQDLDVYQLRRAPYFPTVCSWLIEHLCAEENDGTSIRPMTTVLIRLLEAVCRYIGLPFHFEVFSSMSLTLPEVNDPGQWSYEVSRALGATHYINAPGGRGIFDPQLFAASGVQLSFLEPDLTEYPQRGTEFVPGLSIIDLMMWNSPEEVLRLISNYQLVDP